MELNKNWFFYVELALYFILICVFMFLLLLDREDVYLLFLGASVGLFAHTFPGILNDDNPVKEKDV